MDNPLSVLVRLWQAPTEVAPVPVVVADLFRGWIAHGVAFNGGGFVPGEFKVGGEEIRELVGGAVDGRGVVCGCLRGGGRVRGCQTRCGGVGEAGGALDAKRGLVVDGADGVPPQLAVVGPGVRCVEDAAVGGVVEELHGCAV